MLRCVQLFATPWTAAHQAPLSMEFSKQEYQSVLPFPPPGDLPNPETEPVPPASPALAGRFFTTAPRGRPGGADTHRQKSFPPWNALFTSGFRCRLQWEPRGGRGTLRIPASVFRPTFPWFQDACKSHTCSLICSPGHRQLPAS